MSQYYSGWRSSVSVIEVVVMGERVKREHKRERERKMKRVHEVYKVYIEENLERRKKVGASLMISIITMFVLTLLIVLKQVNYEAKDSYMNCMFLVIVGFLLQLRYVYVDMEYRGEKGGHMSHLLKYTPVEERLLRSYCNRKFWILSGLLLLGLWSLNVGITLFFSGKIKEPVIDTCIFEAAIVICFGLLLSRRKEWFYGRNLVILGSLVIGISVVLVYVPIPIPVERNITGVLCSNVLNEVTGYYGDTEEISLYVKGVYKKYWLKQDSFTGVIRCDRFSFNEEEKELELVFEEGGARVTDHKTSLGYLYADATFQDVILFIYDKVAEGGARDIAYSQENFFFVSEVENYYEAYRRSSYYVYLE